MYFIRLDYEQSQGIMLVQNCVNKFTPTGQRVPSMLARTSDFSTPSNSHAFSTTLRHCIAHSRIFQAQAAISLRVHPRTVLNYSRSPCGSVQNILE